MKRDDAARGNGNCLAGLRIPAGTLRPGGHALGVGAVAEEPHAVRDAQLFRPAQVAPVFRVADHDEFERLVARDPRQQSARATSASTWS